jgi:hypothetical protein
MCWTSCPFSSIRLVVGWTASTWWCWLWCWAEGRSLRHALKARKEAWGIREGQQICIPGLTIMAKGIEGQAAMTINLT